jgi:hypothetical protein
VHVEAERGHAARPGLALGEQHRRPAVPAAAVARVHLDVVDPCHQRIAIEHRHVEPEPADRLISRHQPEQNLPRRAEPAAEPPRGIQPRLLGRRSGRHGTGSGDFPRVGRLLAGQPLLEFVLAGRPEPQLTGGHHPI